MKNEITIRATEYRTDRVIMRLTNEHDDRWVVSCNHPEMEILTTGQDRATKFLVEMEKIARKYFEMKTEAT